MPDITNDGFFSLLPRLSTETEETCITEAQKASIQKALNQFFLAQPYKEIPFPYSKTAFIHDLPGKKLTTKKRQQILLMLLADENFLFGQGRSAVRRHYLNLPFARAAKKAGRSTETDTAVRLRLEYDATDWEQYQRYQNALDNLTKLNSDMCQKSKRDALAFLKALSDYPQQIIWDNDLHEKTDECLELLREYHNRSKIIGVAGKEEKAVLDCKTAISGAIKTAYSADFMNYSILLLWLLFEKHSSCLLRGKDFPDVLGWSKELKTKSINLLEKLLSLFQSTSKQTDICVQKVLDHFGISEDLILQLMDPSFPCLRATCCLAFWDEAIKHSYKCLRFDPTKISYFVPQRPEERIFLHHHAVFENYRKDLATQLSGNRRAIAEYRRAWENRYKNNNEISSVVRKISQKYTAYFRTIEPSLSIYCSPNFIDRTTFLPTKMLLDELKMNILEAALQTVILEQTRKELVEQIMIAFG